MSTVLVLVAALAAAAVLWRAVPEARRRRAEEEGARPFELSGPTAAVPAFVFQPAEIREELPPKPISIARIAFTILLLAGAVAGLAWAAGTFVNDQLARMLQP